MKISALIVSLLACQLLCAQDIESTIGFGVGVSTNNLDEASNSEIDSKEGVNATYGLAYSVNRISEKRFTVGAQLSLYQIRTKLISPCDCDVTADRSIRILNRIDALRLDVLPRVQMKISNVSPSHGRIELAIGASTFLTAQREVSRETDTNLDGSVDVSDAVENSRVTPRYASNNRIGAVYAIGFSTKLASMKNEVRIGVEQRGQISA